MSEIPLTSNAEQEKRDELMTAAGLKFALDEKGNVRDGATLEGWLKRLVQFVEEKSPLDPTIPVTTDSPSDIILLDEVTRILAQYRPDRVSEIQSSTVERVKGL